MSFENTEPLNPDEIFESWDLIDDDEKKMLIKNSVPEIINKLTDFLREFGESGKKMMDLHEKELDIYTRELEKENKTPEETERLLDRINGAVSNAKNTAKDNGKQNLEFITRIGGIALIVAGSIVGAKYNKKVGATLAAGGAVALLGKDAPKALKDIIVNQNDETVAEIQ